jgi:hypothetical protein
MATFIGKLNAVNFIFNSSEISSSRVPGIAIVGAICMAVDTGAFYIVNTDLTLEPYAMPISATISGDVAIGAVEIKNSTDDTRATVGANGLYVDVRASTGLTVDTELPAASSLDGVIGKGLSAPTVGAALLASDGTNLVEMTGTAVDGLNAKITNGIASGTAGAPAVDVISVQGVSGGTAQPISGSIALIAGETYVGKVGGSTIISSNSPALTVAATYVSGDYVGTSATAMIFASCARVDAGTGVIVGCTLIDYALQSVAGELWLFDTAPTPPADSAAWTISDAHAATCIGIIPFSTYYATALNSIALGVPAFPLPFTCGAAVRTLFGCFVTRGAPAYASGDLTFRLAIMQD